MIIDADVYYAAAIISFYAIAATLRRYWRHYAASTFSLRRL